ncbi:MAG: EamA family transporter [Firmicutes bacterium]|nr:EamA family transporter [Bacillota bacterium]
MSPFLFLLLLLNVLMLTSGQLCWKIGIEQVGFELSVAGIFKAIFSPFIFGGLIIYVVATVLWFYILSKVQLSTAYPIQSLCYVFTAIISVLIFKENVALVKWAGLLLITAGAFLVSRG